MPLINSSTDLPRSRARSLTERHFASALSVALTTFVPNVMYQQLLQAHLLLRQLPSLHEQHHQQSSQSLIRRTKNHRACAMLTLNVIRKSCTAHSNRNKVGTRTTSCLANRFSASRLLPVPTPTEPAWSPDTTNAENVKFFPLL